MKKILYFITLFLLFFMVFLMPANAEGEPVKVMSVHYDNSSSVVYIAAKDSNLERIAQKPKYVRLSNPNRIYFDIEDGILIGPKQQLLFENSVIKEIKLAQFGTNPNVVRTVITFEEDYDTSKIKLININGNIIVKVDSPKIDNDYFNLVYDENASRYGYSNIKAISQFIKKVTMPVSQSQLINDKVMEDIQKAFQNSTLPNATTETYDSTVSVDVSSDLKLRTKYYINQYLPKRNGLLVSGLGQITTGKMFYLTAPKRAVIDLPNSFVDRAVKNKEVRLCADGSCKDSAKIGQFEHDMARIVITSEEAEKYIPIYSYDSQSLFIVNSEKLDHTTLATKSSNINKVYVKKLDAKTGEMVLSFTSPVVYSIYRNDDSVNFYLFNVQGYNEQDIIKTLYNTQYSDFTFSLLPKIGVKGSLKGMSKDDFVKVEQSVDSKALRITIKREKKEEPVVKVSRKHTNKNKIVLDAGHGGSDYGAIREGINEKDITLDVTQRVEAILRSKGYKTALTRKDDTFVSLEDRVEFSESEEPEVFVSIHVNSAVATAPNGIETHYYHEYSKSFAEVVHKHMIKEVGTNDRGLFKSKFYVINHTTDPAILVEIGFLSNEAERNELITEERKQKTAKAIAEGIIEYLKKK